MDVARVACEVMFIPAGHIGKMYYVVGPDSLDDDGLAAQYSIASAGTRDQVRGCAHARVGDERAGGGAADPAPAQLLRHAR